MAKRDKIPPREQHLFKHWMETMLGKPLRTITNDAIGIYPAHLTENGDVTLPTPLALREQGAPRRMLMIGSNAFRDSGVGSPYPLKELPTETPNNGQAIVIWLGKSAMGRHQDEPIDTENFEKLRERVEDMRSALCHEYGLHHKHLQARVCIPSQSFREHTDNRACAAIVLATTRDMAPLLQNDIFDKLEHARTTARFDRTAPPGSMAQHFPSAPRPAPKKFVAEKPVALLPAPASEHMRGLLTQSVGPIALHALDANSTVYPRIPTLNGDLTEYAAPLKVSSMDGVTNYTHALTLWLNSDDMRIAFDDLEHLAAHDREQASDHLNKRVAPLRTYLDQRFECPSEFSMLALGLDKPIIITVMINANDQHTKLATLKDELDQLRQRSHDKGNDGSAAPQR